MKKMNRRSFIGGATMAAAAITRDADVKGSSTGPVVETTSGKIRGAVINKVNAFRGIPYGASTDGANRFMPPLTPKPWTGVMDTVEWGPEAPQGPHTEIPEVAATIPKQTISEDCLHLNVWTNGLDAHKRPVLLWLHGGGFNRGNGRDILYGGATQGP